MSFTAITTTDIRDKLVKPVIQSADITAAHNRLIYLAQSLGLTEAEMANTTSTPAVHWIVKEYAIEYATMVRAQLEAGQTTEQLMHLQSVQSDPFGAKWKMQKAIVEDLEGRITREIFTAEAATPEEHGISGYLVRG